MLALELYATVHGTDLLIVISATLNQIANQVRIPNILTIICTDSYSLYKCLVKLGTMKEKRLMIDIMALQESYKQHELTEIWWINSKDNPANALTKAASNKALQGLIDTNELTVQIKGWVKQRGCTSEGFW